MSTVPSPNPPTWPLVREATDLEVPDHNGVFLAIAAGNYYDADLALWTLHAALNGREANQAERAHLNVLRQRRKAAYADLVSWAMTLEAERLARP